MLEKKIEINTSAGKMGTFICHPERNGPHPVVMMFMDAPGIREELRDMARRLGTVGYYVMLPNLYYRENVEELGNVVGEANIANRQRALGFMATLTIEKIMDDAKALIAFADTDPAASKGPMGCIGYCMSGQFSINAAVRNPDRIRAAASFYGVALITDKETSPHLAPEKTDAQLYFACSEHDDYFSLELAEKLKKDMSSKPNVEVEIYPGVHHGFAFPSRPIYDRQSAERHWERIFTLMSTLNP